jgi:hypothetical protein
MVQQSPDKAMKPLTLREDSWRRFRQLVMFSGIAGLIAGIGANLWLISNGTTMKLHLALALGGGIFLSLLLAGALMGLLFLSSRLGHDEDVGDADRDDD